MGIRGTQKDIVGNSSRLIFVGGKGGVGKTTTAAALSSALASKSSDHPVMLISTDPAHSLSDSFGIAIGGEKPVRIIKKDQSNLYVQELDAVSLLDKFKRKNEAELKLLAERGTYFDSDDIQSFFRLSLPGIDEVMSILEIGRLLKDGNLKHLIVDTAPTGHTLSLLRLPLLLETWLDVFDLLQEKHHTLQRHFSGRVIKDNVDGFLEDLRSDTMNVRNLIRDAEKSQFIVVMLPEMLSLFESQRLISALREQGISPHHLVLNGVQNGGGCAVCDSACKKQEKVISLLKEKYRGIDIIQVPLAPHSIQGTNGLEWFASYLMNREEYLVSRSLSEKYDSGKMTRKIQNTKKASLSKLTRDEPKVFIIGGKGGVGKTTVSCSTAITMAARDPSKKYLIFSIDPAHSLSDCLGIKIGSREVEVCENLYAFELDAKSLLDDFKKEYANTVDRLFDNFFKDNSASLGMDFAHDRKVVKALIEMTPPGLDELMALYKVIDLMGRNKNNKKEEVKNKERQYDTIIFDTAPSGHLFRFLELPHLVREWLKAIFQLLIKYKQAVSLGPAAEKLVELSKNIRGIIEIMQDERSCRTIIVSTPEAMVVSETKRLIKIFERLGVPRNLLVINMLRENTGCVFCREIGKGQEDILVELKKMVPKEWVSIPYLPEDVRGIEKLKELGNMMFSG